MNRSRELLKGLQEENQTILFRLRVRILRESSFRLHLQQVIGVYKKFRFGYLISSKPLITELLFPFPLHEALVNTWRI